MRFIGGAGGLAEPVEVPLGSDPAGAGWLGCPIAVLPGPAGVLGVLTSKTLYHPWTRN